jgi:hypothetical protein
MPNCCSIDLTISSTPNESNAGTNLPGESLEFKGIAFCFDKPWREESACGISTYGSVDYVELYTNRVISEHRGWFEDLRQSPLT